MTSTAPSTKRLESSTPSETAIRWPTTELLLRAAHVAGLARRLTALVRGCGVNPTVGPEAARVALDTWLADARRSGVRALETFAAGLEQDGAAIRAALTTPWSSGQAEGQITRLKLIKRQMYGRASFDLLRQRVLLAA